MPFEVNQRVGDYEILGLLGAGGMGHVYRARNIISDRIEAMKVLLPDLTADRDLAVRFISEIRTLAGFDHPNIALLHTAFQMDNQLIMVMEYVEGSTLEQRAKTSAIPVPDVVEYLSQSLSALGYAHARGVVHRDIKPANLMITSHGVIKLMDFGIAKSAVENNLTRPGTTVGSLYYMSPEQVRGGTIDARSDLYSTGIVLYELLAGRRPFESDSTYNILNQQLNELPQPPIEINPSLPPQLNAIILKALQKNPDDRYQSAEEFRNELKKFSGKEVTAPAAVAAVAAPAPVVVAAGEAVPVAVPPPNNIPSATNLPAAAPPAWETVQPQPTQAPPPFQAAPPPPGSPQPMPAQFAQRPGSPRPMPPIPSGKSHKTLWIATGALAAMLAIVAVAMGVPRFFKAHASESQNTLTDQPAATPQQDVTPAAQPTSQPAATPASQPANAPATSPAPAANTAITPLPPPVRTPNANPRQQQQSAPIQVADQPPPAPAGPSASEMEQLEDRYVQLDARAQAALRGVDQLRKQQEASGLGLRGDMETADSRLRSYMSAANQDVHSGRAAQGTRDMDKAESEVAILEKFLGR